MRWRLPPCSGWQAPPPRTVLGSGAAASRSSPICRANHEPGDATVRDDVCRGTTLQDDPVDAGIRPQLLAPQANSVEQHDKCVESVPAFPRLRRRVRRPAEEHHIDVLTGEQPGFDLRQVARMEQQGSVNPVEEAVVEHGTACLIRAPRPACRGTRPVRQVRRPPPRGRSRPPRRWPPWCCGRTRDQFPAVRRTRREPPHGCRHSAGCRLGCREPPFQDARPDAARHSPAARSPPLSRPRPSVPRMPARGSRGYDATSPGSRHVHHQQPRQCVTSPRREGQPGGRL